MGHRLSNTSLYTVFMAVTLYGFPFTREARADRGILPERVFGICFTNTAFRKAATGPISSLTRVTISSNSCSSSISISNKHIRAQDKWLYCFAWVQFCYSPAITAKSRQQSQANHPLQNSKDRFSFANEQGLTISQDTQC